MHTIHVPLKNHPYSIMVGHDILADLGRTLKRMSIGRDAVIITNPVIWRSHGRKISLGLKRSGFSVKLLTVPAGERSKSAKCAFRLIEQIARYDTARSLFIIAFGGGVVGDLAGYVAAAYKRGIPYVQVPTTLLAQVDSAIGGKVAVDLAIGKNLVGAFYQPKLVFSDTSVLSTLPRRQIKNGLAEVVKYGVIADKELFRFLSRTYNSVFDLDMKILTTIVVRSSKIKRDVVVLDEFETKGIRSFLNFGHTVGHAIEAAGGYRRFHHGEAIALGMRVAADISRRKRMCSARAALELNTLMTLLGLPEHIEGVSTSAILSHMKHDKKFRADKNRFILMEKIGKVKICENIPPAVIKKAIAAHR